MQEGVKRLKLSEMEEWKAKARALDEAVEWLDGRVDCEKLMKIDRILRGWKGTDDRST